MGLKELFTRAASAVMASSLVFCTDFTCPKVVKVDRTENVCVVRAAGISMDAVGSGIGASFCGDGQGCVPVYLDATDLKKKGAEDDEDKDSEKKRDEGNYHKNEDDNKKGGDNKEKAEDGKEKPKDDKGKNGDKPDDKKSIEGQGNKGGNDSDNGESRDSSEENNGPGHNQDVRSEGNNGSGDNQDISGKKKIDEKDKATKKRKTDKKRGNKGRNNGDAVEDEESDFAEKGKAEVGDSGEVTGNGEDALESEAVGNGDIKSDSSYDELSDSTEGGNQVKKEKVLRTMRIGLTTAILTVGLAMSGALKYLWMLLFAFFTKKKRKKWHGILTAGKNRFVEIKPVSDGDGRLVQDYIDEYKEPAMVLEKLRESGEFTFLPANTKMDVEYLDLTEKNIRADEMILYNLLSNMRKDIGTVKVHIHNDPAKISIVLKFTV